MNVIVQKYYDDLINSFDFPTSISPDVKDKQVQYDLISISYNFEIKELKREYDFSRNNLFLSIFLFNLVKFSFSKDILVGYNKQAAGYHFNADMSVEDYIYDFKSQFKDFPEYDELDFENEDLKFDKLSILNKIADKIDYSRVLGLDSTAIRSKINFRGYDLLGGVLQ